jgi:5-formyltetrahydrofolate cyclo-ligase
MISAAPVRKAALRAVAQKRRDAVLPDRRLQFAERLSRVGVELVEAFGGRDVALYAPIRSEPDCLPLLSALAAAGFRTLLPAVIGGVGSSLEFRSHRRGDPLAAGPLGAIPEPPISRPAVLPDVVFAPCAAFDRAGGRIGFGRGHYDATLAALRANKRILAVGLAFACQEVDDILLESHDERLDVVITERELLVCTQIGKTLDAVAFHW